MRPVIWTPNAGPQTRFCASSVRDLFYGGAAGGGKSVGLIAKSLRLFHHPTYRAKIFRRTRSQATELWLKADRMIRAAFPGAVWRALDHAWIHPKGGRLELGYLRHDQDLTNEEGQEYAFVGFDELCGFPKEHARFLFSRLRSPEGLPLQFVGTGNPRGIGLQWVKEHYVDPAPPETVIWHKQHLPGGKIVQLSTQFIPARLDDNPHLTATDDYEISLSALSPKLYQALRWGDWSALMGDAFQEWDPAVHVLSWADFAQLHGLLLQVRNIGGRQVEMAAIPKHWPVFMSMDWGSAKPFSIGWWTSDHEGRLYRIHEWYGARVDRNGQTIADVGIRMPIREIARGILEREELLGIHGQVQARPADSAMFDDRGVDVDGPSLAELMSEEGVYLDRSDKRRIPGKQQVHDRLAIGDIELPDGDLVESPGMFVLDTCRDWLRTVPFLPSSPTNPEDIDTATEDHAYDETRYLLMSRPWAPKYVSDLSRWRKRQQKRSSAWAV